MRHSFFARAVALLLIPPLISLLSTAARGQVFVSFADTRKVAKYNFDGTVANPSLVAGLGDPRDLALLGSDLLVTDHGSGSVGRYTAFGGVVNGSFIPGLSTPLNIAVTGTSVFVVYDDIHTKLAKYDIATGNINPTFIPALLDDSVVGASQDGAHLFVTRTAGGGLSEYDAVTGALLVDSFISRSNRVTGIAVSGSTIYVASSGGVGEYTTSGTPINASLISVGFPERIALFGSNIFVVQENAGVGEYTAAGAKVGTFGINMGKDNPQGIAVLPEPYGIALVSVLAGERFVAGDRGCKVLIE